jgi:tRNA (guanine-N7-)-methyltransferase
VPKNKLRRFAEMADYPNVVAAHFNEVFQTDFRLKGRWCAELFGNTRPLVLELGCGRGEYTVALARRFPNKNFLGVDIKGARMWVGATDALQSGLVNAAFLRTRIEFICSCFAAGEVSEIWITFPDPQPQQSRENRRLTSPRFLQSYRQIMQPDGVVHLKTDSESLFTYTQEILNANHLPILISTADLYGEGSATDILSVQTCYEKKFMQQGFTIKYLQFRIEEPAVERQTPTAS